MKKFLRLWLRHPLSITYLIICIAISIAEMNPAPIVIGIIPSTLCFITVEFAYGYCDCMKRFGNAAFRRGKCDKNR